MGCLLSLQSIDGAWEHYVREERLWPFLLFAAKVRGGCAPVGWATATSTTATPGLGKPNIFRIGGRNEAVVPFLSQYTSLQESRVCSPGSSHSEMSFPVTVMTVTIHSGEAGKDAKQRGGPPTSHHTTPPPPPTNRQRSFASGCSPRLEAGQAFLRGPGCSISPGGAAMWYA